MFEKMKSKSIMGDDTYSYEHFIDCMDNTPMTAQLVELVQCQAVSKHAFHSSLPSEASLRTFHSDEKVSDASAFGNRR